jgi:hypothetical protein
MADALLAGLPRIVRAADEIRLRGLLTLAIGFAAAVWWTMQWLLDQPVDATRTWLVAIVVCALAGILVVLNVPWRIRDGLKETRRPSMRVVYETRADATERRTRLSGAVFLTAIVALMFDALAGWGGIVAGGLVGAAVALGAGDIWESGRWAAAERDRDSDLYVTVGGRALVASYGRPVIYEVEDPPPNLLRDR